MERKPCIVVVSHVFPLPRHSGQRQRVYYTLKALRDVFHVTFVTFGDTRSSAAMREALSSLCDEVVVLPSNYAGGKVKKVWHRLAGEVYRLFIRSTRDGSSPQPVSCPRSSEPQPT